jgi:starch synthase (maltosyl-transferring)
MQAGTGHIVIETVQPELNGGRYRAKAVIGDWFEVSADIFRDGTAVLAATLRYENPNGKVAESPMAHHDNDRWRGSFRPERIGRWRYTIEAWTDDFATWHRDVIKKADAGQVTRLDLDEGALLIERRLEAVPDGALPPLRRALELLRAGSPEDLGDAAQIEVLLTPEVAELMSRHADRTGSTAYQTLELTVDRPLARAGAWYEFFPRSTGPEGRHGTFQTSAEHLATVADMGFDVVYLPPIHPIGETNRKGKNNALATQPDDLGSPWAIGNRCGGHTAVDPNLGTLEDFDAFMTAAERSGVEIALDFAIQCSPDHPWVTEHPEWFHHRPDGSIMHAENPPKKYEDIYPINFDTADRDGLWNELRGVIDFWISHRVKVFRVDNPHTKSFAFWEWLIDGVQTEHPDVIFLSEAFTRPKVMHLLAKLGFTQSYTYFTWRNEKGELTDYLTELTRPDVAAYFRPNFFTNTQDILTEYLQRGGPPAFKVRLALASLLSPSYGIYSGFEFYENVPLREGSEEYLDSEKYELRHRNWDQEDGTLIPYVRRINEIRRANPALALLTNLRFEETGNENVIAFSKTTPGHDPILVLVNLDPSTSQEATITLDDEIAGAGTASYRVHELISGAVREWPRHATEVALDPAVEPVLIFRIGA